MLYCPGGHLGNSKQSNNKNVQHSLAVLAAMAMRWYNTTRITQ
jgi:hypothetical protein